MIIAETTKNGIKVNLEGAEDEILKELEEIIIEVVEFVRKSTAMTESETFDFVKAIVDWRFNVRRDEIEGMKVWTTHNFLRTGLCCDTQRCLSSVPVRFEKR